MQPIARQPDEYISLLHAIRAEDQILLHHADDEAGEIVIGRGVDPGHLCRLATDEGAAILAAARGDPGHDLLDDFRDQEPGGEVIEEEEGMRALHEDVVHAVVDQIVADGGMPVGVDRDAQLGAHAIGARHEHGPIGFGGNPEHAAEAAERAARTRSEGGFHHIANTPLDRVRAADVDARRRVVERALLGWTLAHAESSSSKATRVRNSATRREMSSPSISRRRCTENFSTANDPIAEP